MSTPNTIQQSAEFSDWLRKLNDRVGRAKIVARIMAAGRGNFGDCEPVGDGISEMRIHYGPGYRVYFKRKGDVIYVLLCGGTKRTQSADIGKAKTLAKLLDR